MHASTLYDAHHVHVRTCVHDVNILPRPLSASWLAFSTASRSPPIGRRVARCTMHEQQEQEQAEEDSSARSLPSSTTEEIELPQQHKRVQPRVLELLHEETEKAPIVLPGISSPTVSDMRQELAGLPTPRTPFSLGTPSPPVSPGAAARHMPAPALAAPDDMRERGTPRLASLYRAWLENAADDGAGAATIEEQATPAAQAAPAPMASSLLVDFADSDTVAFFRKFHKVQTRLIGATSLLDIVGVCQTDVALVIGAESVSLEVGPRKLDRVPMSGNTLFHGPNTHFDGGSNFNIDACFVSSSLLKIHFVATPDSDANEAAAASGVYHLATCAVVIRPELFDDESGRKTKSWVEIVMRRVAQITCRTWQHERRREHMDFLQSQSTRVVLMMDLLSGLVGADASNGLASSSEPLQRRVIDILAQSEALLMASGSGMCLLDSRNAAENITVRNVLRSKQPVKVTRTMDDGDGHIQRIVASSVGGALGDKVGGFWSLLVDLLLSADTGLPVALIWVARNKSSPGFNSVDMTFFHSLRCMLEQLLQSEIGQMKLADTASQLEEESLARAALQATVDEFQATLDAVRAERSEQGPQSEKEVEDSMGKLLPQESHHRRAVDAAAWRAYVLMSQTMASSGASELRTPQDVCDKIHEAVSTICNVAAKSIELRLFLGGKDGEAVVRASGRGAEESALLQHVITGQDGTKLGRLLLPAAAGLPVADEQQKEKPLVPVLKPAALLAGTVKAAGEWLTQWMSKRAAMEKQLRLLDREVRLGHLVRRIEADVARLTSERNQLSSKVDFLTEQLAAAKKSLEDERRERFQLQGECTYLKRSGAGPKMFQDRAEEQGVRQELESVRRQFGLLQQQHDRQTEKYYRSMQLARTLAGADTV